MLKIVGIRYFDYGKTIGKGEDDGHIVCNYY